MKTLCAVLILFHLFLIQTSLACNGHDIRIIEINKCDEADQIVRVSEDFNLKFTRDCFLVATGCVYYKGLNSAKLEVSLKRGKEVLLNHSEDLCKNSILGGRCPVQQGKHCFNNNDLRWSVRPIRRLMSTLVGTYDADYVIHHDKATSCGTVKFRIVQV